MLNGIDPIIIFNFKKLPVKLDAATNIPIAGSEGTALPFSLPAIPIYLSENLTGIFIVSEDKNIDIETSMTTVSDASKVITNQRPISSTVTVKMVASRDSIGVSLFAAMSDFLFPKLTSKEYSITYLHGAVTVFEGLLNSFSITQNSNDDLYEINMSLIKPPAEAVSKVLEVPKVTGTVPI